MKLSISEIINTAAKKKLKTDKVAFLQSNDSKPLRMILRLMYDKDIEFLLPSTPPPWKKNDYVGVEGMLYKETRRLRIFIKGGGYDNLNQTKRESLFISLLEDIDNKDAELLCKIIARDTVTGLTRKTVEDAFPTLMTERF